MFAMSFRSAKATSAVFGASGVLCSMYCSFWIIRWALIAYRERQLGHRLVFVIGPEINAAILAVILGLAVFFVAFRLLSRAKNRQQSTRVIVACTLVLGLLVLCAWICHQRATELKLQDALKLQDDERSAMAPYETDLHAGLTKSEVEAYLASRAAAYSNGYDLHGNQELSVKIAEEPGDGFVCDRWFVYAEMNFNSVGMLLGTHMQKVGHCL
jgi:hypothetical protein